MKRWVALALGAAALAVGIAGCASAPQPLSTPSAQVTIGDVDVGPYPVLCSQVGSQWTIESLPRSPGFTAFVNTDGPTSAGLVHLRDVGGFSGSFARGADGEGQATIENSTFVISGNAVGVAADQPTEQARRPFTIETAC